MISNPQNLEEIKSLVISFVRAYESIFYTDQVIDFMNCDLDSAKRQFSNWQNGINREKEIISSLWRLWPDGHDFLNELDKEVLTQVDFFNNVARWREFQKKEFNIEDHKSIEKRKKFIAKNRELSTQLENLIKNANDTLKKLTGIDMYSSFVSYQDPEKLDTSPDGMNRTIVYIQKVRILLDEFNKLFQKYLEHISHSMYSEKLLRDKQWVSTAETYEAFILQYSSGDIPGKLTPFDLVEVLPGCLNLHTRLCNLKDYSEQLYFDHSNYFEGQDSRGIDILVKNIGKINNERINLASEIDNVLKEIKSIKPSAHSSVERIDLG